MKCSAVHSTAALQASDKKATAHLQLLAALGSEGRGQKLVCCQQEGPQAGGSLKVGELCWAGEKASCPCAAEA